MIMFWIWKCDRVDYCFLDVLELQLQFEGMKYDCCSDNGSYWGLIMFGFGSVDEECLFVCDFQIEEIWLKNLKKCNYEFFVFNCFYCNWVQVSALESVISKGGRVAEKDVVGVIELLMNELIKLDGITADGDVKLQRKMQVIKLLILISILSRTQL